jgi:small subunit ribosomal protein S17
MSNETGHKRTAVGRIVSDKMDKTIVVEVVRTVKHPRYKKFIQRTSKLHSHDPENRGRIGDLVKIQESRPYSKKKTWEMVEILENSEEQTS